MADNRQIHKRYRRGRSITVRGQTLLWRKRMQNFRTYKKKLLDCMLTSGLPQETLQALLDTPAEALGGKSPREKMTPVYIKAVYRYVKRSLTYCTK